MVLLLPNIYIFWDTETFLYPHPIFSALPNLNFLTSGTQKFKFDKFLPHTLSPIQNELKEPKSILILTIKLQYTYFWKTLPVGALIWLTPIWLTWTQIAQPTSNHLKSQILLSLQCFKLRCDFFGRFCSAVSRGGEGVVIMIMAGPVLFRARVPEVCLVDVTEVCWGWGTAGKAPEQHTLRRSDFRGLSHKWATCYDLVQMCSTHARMSTGMTTTYSAFCHSSRETLRSFRSSFHQPCSGSTWNRYHRRSTDPLGRGYCFAPSTWKCETRNIELGKFTTMWRHKRAWWDELKQNKGNPAGYSRCGIAIAYLKVYLVVSSLCVLVMNVCCALSSWRSKCFVNDHQWLTQQHFLDTLCKRFFSPGASQPTWGSTRRPSSPPDEATCQWQFTSFHHTNSRVLFKLAGMRKMRQLIT